MSLLQRWLPAPLLSLVLLLVWMLLQRGGGAGQWLLGAALALAVPLLTRRLRNPPARLRNPRVLVRYVLVVIFDVVMSNLQVGRDVLRLRRRRPQPRFVVIPLDIGHPGALATLALVTTIVPGTVWSELALDRRSLLLHVWDAPDEEAFIARYKARYEQPLREIFE